MNPTTKNKLCWNAIPSWKLTNTRKPTVLRDITTTSTESNQMNIPIVLSHHNYCYQQMKDVPTLNISTSSPQTTMVKCITNKMVDLQTKLRRSSICQQQKTPLTIAEIMDGVQQHGMKPSAVEFLRSQLINSGRKDKGHRWSTQDKARALGIFYKSRQGYETLSTLFSMPSQSTLQRFVQGTTPFSS